MWARRLFGYFLKAQNFNNSAGFKKVLYLKVRLLACGDSKDVCVSLHSQPVDSLGEYNLPGRKVYLNRISLRTESITS